MKKFFVAALAALVVLSCKKEKGEVQENEPVEPLLTEILEDGKLSLRFEYNNDRILTRINGYAEGALDNSIVISYDSTGKLMELTSLSATGVPVNRFSFTYDDAGKLLVSTGYLPQDPDPNTPKGYYAYQYNEEGLVKKVISKDKDEKVTSELRFTYDESGNLKESVLLYPHAGLMFPARRIFLSTPKDNRKSPLEFLNMLFGTETLLELYRETVTVRDIAIAGEVTKEHTVYNAEEYNADGTVKKSTATYHFVKPDKPDAVFNRDFIYTKE